MDINEKLTVQEWIQTMNDLGYYMTKQHVVRTNDPMGWKALVFYLANILMAGCFLVAMFAVALFILKNH